MVTENKERGRNPPLNTMTKPYDQVGPAGVEANIQYYLAREQRLNVEALAARQEREHWERALDNLDRNDPDKED